VLVWLQVLGACLLIVGIPLLVIRLLLVVFPE